MASKRRSFISLIFIINCITCTVTVRLSYKYLLCCWNSLIVNTSHNNLSSACAFVFVTTTGVHVLMISI